MDLERGLVVVVGVLQGRECLCPLVAEGVKRGKGEQLADPHNLAGSWHYMRLGHATVGTCSQNWGAESVPLPFTPECRTRCVPGWCLTRRSGRQWGICQCWQSLGHRRPSLPLLKAPLHPQQLWPLTETVIVGLAYGSPFPRRRMHVWVHITCVLVSTCVWPSMYICVCGTYSHFMPAASVISLWPQTHPISFTEIRKLGSQREPKTTSFPSLLIAAGGIAWSR